MSLTPLNNLLGRSLKKAGIARQVASAMVLGEYSKIIDRIFGEEISKKIKPLYVKDKVLTVACLHSVLAQELKFKEREILHEINHGSNFSIIESIRYLL